MNRQENFITSKNNKNNFNYRDNNITNTVQTHLYKVVKMIKKDY